MKAYPNYQYSSFFKNGREEQVVIRAETWEKFLDRKRKIDSIFDKKEAEVTVDGKVCPKCGAKLTISKAGNEYCSATCWLKGDK